MIKNKTVLVLGAGANKPYGLPLGRGLKALVLGSLGTDPGRSLLINHFGWRADAIDDFRTALSESGRGSVDLFLEHRRDCLTLGKLAIAQCLLPLEIPNNHALFDTDKEERWYTHLLDRMLEGGDFDSFPENRLSVITLNYDRTLEIFLFTALKNTFARQDEDVAEVLRAIPITHFYGSLGPLPWEVPTGEPCVPPNNRLDLAPDLLDLSANSLRVIVEDHDEDMSNRCRAVLADAERIYLLGFGFHPLNVERLALTSVPKEAHRAGTALNLTDMERSQIETVVLKERFSLYDQDCIGFFRNIVHEW